MSYLLLTLDSSTVVILMMILIISAVWANEDNNNDNVYTESVVAAVHVLKNAVALNHGDLPVVYT